MLCIFEAPVGKSNIEKYFRECHSVYALWHFGDYRNQTVVFVIIKREFADAEMVGVRDASS